MSTGLGSAVSPRATFVRDASASFIALVILTAAFLISPTGSPPSGGWTGPSARAVAAASRRKAGVRRIFKGHLVPCDGSILSDGRGEAGAPATGEPGRRRGRPPPRRPRRRGGRRSRGPGRRAR